MTLDVEMQSLRGTNILIVEDEAILALDLASTIADEGASVEGPIYRLDQAMALDHLDALDAAILDVDLDGTEVFEFADRLTEMSVPIVFHTGRADVAPLHADYPDARVVRKPCTTLRIVSALASAMAHIRAAASRPA